MMIVLLQTMELHQMCDDGCDLADHGVASNVMMDVIFHTMELHQM
jgi:hypothetical protein